MAKAPAGVWGIDVGQCALKAVRVELAEGEARATAFDYIEYPKILSQPDADPDQLIRDALEQFLSRNNLRGDMVVMGVPGQSGLSRIVKLPPVEEKKVADIVKFEAKQQIPFPLEEVVWDFQKLSSGEVTQGFAMETEIGLFAMKREIVARYLQHFQDVNVEVHEVQMVPWAICNFLAYDLLAKDAEGNSIHGEEEEKPEKKQCVVALDIGTDSSNLVITDGEKILWQRTIPQGGNHFTRAMTKDLKLTFAKAEHLKRNAVKSPDLKKILASLKTILNEFVGEVQRSLGYFTNTNRDSEIQYMVGLGNAFRLPGLQKYMQEKLQLEVRKVQRFDRLGGEDVVDAPQFKENLLTFAVGYGLALQGLQAARLKTNLLPYEVKVERLVRAKKPWAVATAAALLLAVSGITFGRAVERGAVVNKRIDDAMRAADVTMNEIKKYQKELKDEEDRIVQSKLAIKKIGAGVEERFNWQLLYQYINSCIPQPNGDKLSQMTTERVEARAKYYTQKAREAHEWVKNKRFARDDEAKLYTREKEEKDIKPHLIQINVEGVGALYSEDLSNFYKTVFDDTSLVGMTPTERQEVLSFNDPKKSDKGKLPFKGWIVEIRGYTYYNPEAQKIREKKIEKVEPAFHNFVENTLIENLARPENIFPGKKLPKNLEEIVRKNLSHVVLYKRLDVEDPESGDFKLIKSSFLKLMAGGPPEPKGAFPGVGGGPGIPGGPGKESSDKRKDWVPLGEIAPAVFREGPGSGHKFGGAPGPGGFKGGVGKQEEKTEVSDFYRQPRVEFVVMFIWREPLVEPAPPPGLPGAPGVPGVPAGPEGQPKAAQG